MLDTTATIQLGTETVPYRLVRSNKRRHTIALQIAAPAQLVVTVPLRTATKDIETVIFARASWILRGLREASARQERQQSRQGTVPYLGQHYPVHVSTQSRRSPVLLQEDGLHITLPATPTDEAHQQLLTARLNNWYRAQARAVLQTRLNEWAGRFGVSYGRFLLSSPTRRWGSCDAHNNIRLNWRLILLPLEAIDYVVAHELAHVLHKDHSPRFWAALEKVMPDYPHRQKILTEQGRDLLEM